MSLRTEVASKWTTSLIVVSTTCAAGVLAFGQPESQSSAGAQVQAARKGKRAPMVIEVRPRHVSATTQNGGLPLFVSGDADFDTAMGWTNKTIDIGFIKKGVSTSTPASQKAPTEFSDGGKTRSAIFTRTPPSLFRDREGGISSITVTVTITNEDTFEKKEGKQADIPIGFGGQ